MERYLSFTLRKCFVIVCKMNRPKLYLCGKFEAEEYQKEIARTIVATQVHSLFSNHLIVPLVSLKYTIEDFGLGLDGDK